MRDLQDEVWYHRLRRTITVLCREVVEEYLSFGAVVQEL